MLVCLSAASSADVINLQSSLADAASWSGCSCCLVPHVPDSCVFQVRSIIKGEHQPRDKYDPAKPSALPPRGKEGAGTVRARGGRSASADGTRVGSFDVVLDLQMGDCCAQAISFIPQDYGALTTQVISAQHIKNKYA